MPNYKQTAISGEMYQRADSVHISNPMYGDKSISYKEELVINVGNEQIIKSIGDLVEKFTPENALSEFPRLNPADDTLLGQNRTY